MKRKLSVDNDNLDSIPSKSKKKKDVSTNGKSYGDKISASELENRLNELARHFQTNQRQDFEAMENSIIENFCFDENSFSKFAKLILKKFFANSKMIDFLAKVATKFKAISAKLPALIFGHSNFGEVVYELKHGEKTKLAVLRLLERCVSTEGENILHEAHVPILLGAYSGKLTDIDRIIYGILRIYEKRGNVDFSKYFPLVWGEIGLEKYASLKTLGPALWNRSSTDDVLNCLDPQLMKTCYRRLPLKISLDSEVTGYSDCYDPRFLLPLFFSILGSESVIDCRRFAIQQSCLSYTICCLSLHDSSLRGAAYGALRRFRDHLFAFGNNAAADKAKFREKPQILYPLNLLRQSIDRPLIRLPPIISLFLAQAVQLTAMPYHDVYSTVNSYLLIKPRLDLWDVPEFYKLFQSSMASERFWILKLMSDGLREAADYRLYERRKAFRILLSFYDWAACNDVEPTARVQILRLINAACQFGPPAVDLCYKYNLIGWLAGVGDFVKQKYEVDPMASILASVYENVVTKDTTPTYVATLWRGTAEVFERKVQDLKKRIGEDVFDKFESLVRFRNCLTIVREKST